jgi:hypothetical protein
MSSKEQEDLKKCYMEDEDREYEPDDEELDEYISSTFDDDFGDKYSNLSCSKLANQKVAVIGELGLWDGRHKIIPKEFDSLSRAIHACLEDLNRVYEDQYGNLHVEAHHHDGVNCFIIKKVTDKGLRCLHYRKEVWGA